MMLPVVALATLAFFMAAALAVHGLRPELDWVASQMSLYLIGDWGPLLQAAYTALAVGMFTLGVGLYRALARSARSAAPLLLFAIAAPALVATAYAPMRFPDEAMRLEHLVHGVAAQTTFLCATAGMVLQALRFRLDPHWRRLAPAALLLALLCFAAVWMLALWRDLPRGLAQKTVIALIVAWLAGAALQLLRQACARRAATDPRRLAQPSRG